MANEGAPAPQALKLKQSGFTDAFWSADYAGGLGVLFQKLQQGVVENQQVLTIASMRADAEEMYSDRLGDIAPTIDRMTGGFARDDGASTRKAYEGVRGEMVEASKNHRKIADNIRELVVNPFSRWCDAHAARIQNSQDDLQSKIKAHDRQADAVKKLRSHYFNKCRLVEDLEEENKMAFAGPAKESPKPQSPPPPKIVLPEDEIEELPIDIGDQTYPPDKVRALLTDMLEKIPLGEHKVPILGVYQNVSSGTDITDYILKEMKASSVGYAERIGNTFANSSRMKYQWKPRAFQMSGVPEKRKPLSRSITGGSADGILESPTVGNITETLSNWNPLNNPFPNETPAERLKRESREADDKYKAGVRRLDLLRCNLEESMMDHLKFLERCETDRLKAIKSVILDFSGAISNSIPSFQSQVDHMMLYQETIQPLGDLRYLLENYKTGAFVPKVTPYENYYGSVDDQTFGVDLEARARADRKRVPVIVTAILTFLDNHYPDLEGDEARRNIWLVDVPLAATHHLRNQVNNGAAVPRDLLEKYEMPIVASLLKLYLLELPDSLVSSQVYEIIKTIYATTQDAVHNPISTESIDATPRIKVLQSTLGQLRLNNIATLDAMTTHFSRLIDLTSADEAYVSALATTLAPCVLRPRTENSLTLEERFAYRLIRDLFEHKEAIFGELKRQSSTLSGSNSVSSRQRAVSTADESSRRANMEARARAITEQKEQKQRDKSPGPGIRHRRDKSTDGSVGRFPVVASPRPDGGHGRNVSSVAPSAAKRTSLEVPGSNESSPVQPRNQSAVDRNAAAREANASSSVNMTTNGHHNQLSPPDSVSSPGMGLPGAFSGGGPGPHIPPPLDDDDQESDNSPSSAAASAGTGSRPGSLKRSAVTTERKPVGINRVSGAGGSLSRRLGQSQADDSHPAAGGSQGVQLSDRAMDDFS
ncbi:Rho-GTPase-activating protein 8 [Cladophialophora chaetospira]|uniref:Rho-GTPase-activating protein 8 n=1 Tax=Cladophialophora chaetospira TaxID=386627 RepID=A0AA39CBR9_9EURO|nr:Rho-GTPase-activating protein 8 [Cladophialophora chaetospira]